LLDKNTKVQGMANPEAIFDELDFCKDGAVTQGELELVDILNHHLPLDIDRSDARVQALFGKLDLDGNKAICKEEFVEKWDTIVECMPHLGEENFSDRLQKLFHRSGPREAPLYAKGGVSTFFHKPLYGKAGERPPADCVFYGCPFDAGSTYRSGLRFGPKKIREVSQMLLTDYNNDYASWMDRNFGKMKIFDAGDCAPTPFDLITAVGQIYVFAKVLWNTSKKLVAIGGDHTLSWSFLAAARDKNEGKPVPIIHFDAHLDTGDEYLGSKLSHGTALGRAGAGGCIDFEKSTHIGIRGISAGPELQQKSDEEGYRTITMDEFDQIGAKDAAAIVKERIGDVPCVIIFDLDVMDTSDCPGVGFPTPGGMRNRELMTFLRELRGLNIMGGSIVEYTPDYDPTDSTAMMASQAAYEIMALALDNVEAEEAEEE